MDLNLPRFADKIKRESLPMKESESYEEKSMEMEMKVQTKRGLIWRKFEVTTGKIFWI